MRIDLSALALAALTLAACPSHSPETRAAGTNDGYDLRGRMPVGHRAIETTRIELRDARVRVNGRNVPGGQTMVCTSTDDTQVLAARDGVPTELRIEHLEDACAFRMELLDEVEEEIEPGDLRGRTEIAKRAGEKWVRTLVGAPATEAQQRDLGSGLDLGTSYPARVVVGETWRVEGTRLRGLLGGEDEILSMQGGFTETLKSVEVTADDRIAHISFHGTVELTMRDGDGQDSVVGLSLDGTYRRSLVHALDLDGELVGTMKTEVSIEEEGVATRLVVDGPLTIRLEGAMAEAIAGR